MFSRIGAVLVTSSSSAVQATRLEATLFSLTCMGLITCNAVELDVVSPSYGQELRNNRHESRH